MDKVKQYVIDVVNASKKLNIIIKWLNFNVIVEFNFL